jgi:hypothetical protein
MAEVVASGYSSTAGDKILSRAGDDFAVTPVPVTLTDTKSHILKHRRTARDPDRRRYPATMRLAAG